jgi:hypothetical protein
VSFLAATFVVVAFALTIERLNLAARGREVVSRATECLKVLRDPSMDDEAKERILQHQALRLFGLFWVLIGGGILALGLPLSAVWLLDLVGVMSVAAVLSVLGRIEFLVGVTVVGSVVFLLLRWAHRP